MNLRDEGRWSIPIARLSGVQIRVHVFFWLFALWTGYIAWRAQQSPGNQGDILIVAGFSLGILALSVLAQELGRWKLLRAFGGDCQQLVLGPFGGMSKMTCIEQPREEMLVHLAAPAISAAVIVVTATILIGTGHWNTQLLHLLQPANVAEGAIWIVAAKLVLWINTLLMVLSLIPAFPFHGGQALRAAILWRAPHLGRREASRWVIGLARLIACLMVVGAVFVLRDDPGLQTWSALVLLAVLVFLGAEHEQTTAVELSHEQPAAAVFDSRVAPAAEPRRLRSFATAEDAHDLSELDAQMLLPSRSEQQSTSDAGELDGEEDELQVDEILTRVHQHGLGSLTQQDREVLDRASRRYRQRLSAGT